VKVAGEFARVTGLVENTPSKSRTSNSCSCHVRTMADFIVVFYQFTASDCPGLYFDILTTDDIQPHVLGKGLSSARLACRLDNAHYFVKAMSKKLT
jgi:hypothetical protein